MYKFDREHQYQLSDFNQPNGLKNVPRKPLGKKGCCYTVV